MYQHSYQEFGGRSLEELVVPIRSGPGAKGLADAADGYRQLSGTLDKVRQAADAALRQAQAAHQGLAAEASQLQMTQLSLHADEAQTQATAGEQRMIEGGELHSATRNAMPEPKEEPALWRAVTIPLDPSHSYLNEMTRYEQQRQQAAGQMAGYQDGANGSIDRFGIFAEPTTAPVGLGESGGRASPGFPAGGGAGVSVASGQGGGGAGPSVVGGQGGGVSPGAGAVGPPSGAPVVGGFTPPVAPQGAGPLPGTGAGVPASTSRGAGLTPPIGGAGGVSGTSLTPLRPRAAVPGAWAGAGGTLGPGGRPGVGGAAVEPVAGRGGTPGRGGGSGVPFMPMGMGAGRGRSDNERRRPSWLTEDDPEAAFGPMPPHVPPVIESTDDLR